MKRNTPRILFVCLGNICRSTAAQAVFETMSAEAGITAIVDSAGTYGGHAGQEADPRMKVHARRRGYNLTHRARKVRENDFDCFDLIIAMDDNNFHDLRALAPTADDQRKVQRMASYMRHNPHWDYIPDPYYEGAEGFELVLDMLEDGCATIIEKIKSNSITL